MVNSKWAERPIYLSIMTCADSIATATSVTSLSQPTVYRPYCGNMHHSIVNRPLPSISGGVPIAKMLVRSFATWNMMRQAADYRPTYLRWRQRLCSLLRTARSSAAAVTADRTVYDVGLWYTDCCLEQLWPAWVFTYLKYLLPPKVCYWCMSVLWLNDSPYYISVWRGE